MAERSLSVCDLDNEPTISVARVVVTVDGKERTFDLCDTHLEAFRAAVAPFAGGTGRRRGRPAKSAGRAAKKTAAKKTVAKKTTAKATAAKSTARAAKKSTAKATVAKRPGRPAKATKRTSAGGASNTAAVRAWARQQGIAVPERGRIGRDLLERYQAANA